MKKALKLTFSLSFVFLCVNLISAQRVDIKPFAVAQTNTVDDLKKLKAANPKITTEEFVKTANSLLEKKGLNFVFAFDANTCQKIETAKKTRKDQNAPLSLRTALKSVSGEPASLLLPEPGFDRSECAPCYVSLPILELTDKDFITIVEGSNIKFHLPQNFIASEAFLVDGKDLTTIKTKWKLPFRTTPLSISGESDILYVGFDESELSDLVLMIYSDGAFQFAAKTYIDAEKKGVLLKDFPKDAGNPNLAFIRFEKAETSQTIKFSKRCEH